MDRKISMEYWKKIAIKVFWCATSHIFFLILRRYVVFFIDLTNHAISQSIEEIHSYNSHHKQKK